MVFWRTTTFPSVAATTMTCSSMLYLSVPEVPFPLFKPNEIAKIKLSGKVLWEHVVHFEGPGIGGKGKERECFRTYKKTSFPTSCTHENSMTWELLEKNYWRSSTKSRAKQSKMYFLRKKKITNLLLDIKLHFIPWQLHNCLQHSLVPSRARLPSAKSPSQGKMLTDKPALLPTEQPRSKVIEKYLTACWQFRPTFPFSPRTTFIRQCRVRPFRCRPEQWCSISPRQLRIISGLSEKSSINMRR